jgi:DnaK suppressor protein
MPNTSRGKKDNSGSGNLKQFRQILDEKATELRSHMGTQSASAILAIQEDPYDSADWAEKSHEEWIFLQKNSVDMALLREIEEALLRMREGTYGTCQDCGLPVSKKRLEALPWARFCVSCQERRTTGHN